MPVDSKLQKETIWILWEILLFEAGERSSGYLKIIKSLLNLFCVQFKKTYIRKRKYIIYFSISLLTELVDNKIPIINNEKICENAKKKINVIYKQIKKNEISPETDYLFNNSFTKGNLEKTIENVHPMSTPCPPLIRHMCAKIKQKNIFEISYFIFQI